jgi:diadenylate cyclase
VGVIPAAFLEVARQFLQALRWQDLADIALVSLVLYRLFLLIRGTRAVQLLRGLLFLLVAYLVSSALQLHTITWLVQSTATIILVAIPVVFQPELRRALSLLGQGELFRPEFFRSVEDPGKLVEELVVAARTLASRKVGALIIIERQTGLNEFIETGTLINGMASSDLITSLFHTSSPLHDGAIILRGDRIVAAGTVLPLAENVHRTTRRTIGTRHRAALGLTETTDALAIVVSEETGAISVAQEGQLQRYLSDVELRLRLDAIYQQPRQPALNLGLALFHRK